MFKDSKSLFLGNLSGGPSETKQTTKRREGWGAKDPYSAMVALEPRIMLDGSVGDAVVDGTPDQREITIPTVPGPTGTSPVASPSDSSGKSQSSSQPSAHSTTTAQMSAEGRKAQTLAPAPKDPARELPSQKPSTPESKTGGAGGTPGQGPAPDDGGQAASPSIVDIDGTTLQSMSALTVVQEDRVLLPTVTISEAAPNPQTGRELRSGTPHFQIAPGTVAAQPDNSQRLGLFKLRITREQLEDYVNEKYGSDDHGGQKITMLRSGFSGRYSARKATTDDSFKDLQNASKLAGFVAPPTSRDVGGDGDGGVELRLRLAGRQSFAAGERYYFTVLMDYRTIIDRKASDGATTRYKGAGHTVIQLGFTVDVAAAQPVQAPSQTQPTPDQPDSDTQSPAPTQDQAAPDPGTQAPAPTQDQAAPDSDTQAPAPGVSQPAAPTVAGVAGSEFKLLGDDSQGTYRFGFVAPGQGTTKDVGLALITGTVANATAAFTDPDTGDAVTGWAFENGKVVRKAMNTGVEFTAKKVRMTLTGENQATQSITFDLKLLVPLTSVTFGDVDGETPPGGFSREAVDPASSVFTHTYLVRSDVSSARVALGKLTPNSGVALGDLTVKLIPKASGGTWGYNKETGVVSLLDYNSNSRSPFGAEMTISDKLGNSLTRKIELNRNDLPAVPTPVYGEGRDSYDADLTTVTLQLPDPDANVGDSVQWVRLVKDVNNPRDIISDLFESGKPSTSSDGNVTTVTLTRKQVGGQPVSLFDSADRSTGPRTLSGSILLIDKSGESATWAFTIQVESPPAPTQDQAAPDPGTQAPAPTQDQAAPDPGTQAPAQDDSGQAASSSIVTIDAATVQSMSALTVVQPDSILLSTVMISEAALNPQTGTSLSRGSPHFRIVPGDVAAQPDTADPLGFFKIRISRKQLEDYVNAKYGLAAHGGQKIAMLRSGFSSTSESSSTYSVSKGTASSSIPALTRASSLEGLSALITAQDVGGHGDGGVEVRFRLPQGHSFVAGERYLFTGTLNYRLIIDRRPSDGAAFTRYKGADNNRSTFGFTLDVVAAQPVQAPSQTQPTPDQPDSDTQAPAPTQDQAAPDPGTQAPAPRPFAHDRGISTHFKGGLVPIPGGSQSYRIAPGAKLPDLRADFTDMYKARQGNSGFAGTLTPLGELEATATLQRMAADGQTVDSTYSAKVGVVWNPSKRVYEIARKDIIGDFEVGKKYRLSVTWDGLFTKNDGGTVTQVREGFTTTLTLTGTDPANMDVSDWVWGVKPGGTGLSANGQVIAKAPGEYYFRLTGTADSDRGDFLEGSTGDFSAANQGIRYNLAPGTRVITIVDPGAGNAEIGPSVEIDPKTGLLTLREGTDADGNSVWNRGTIRIIATDRFGNSRTFRVIPVLSDDTLPSRIEGLDQEGIPIQWKNPAITAPRLVGLKSESLPQDQHISERVDLSRYFDLDKTSEGRPFLKRKTNPDPGLITVQTGEGLPLAVTPAAKGVALILGERPGEAVVEAHEFDLRLLNLSLQSFEGAYNGGEVNAPGRPERLVPLRNGMLGSTKAHPDGDGTIYEVKNGRGPLPLFWVTYGRLDSSRYQIKNARITIRSLSGTDLSTVGSPTPVDYLEVRDHSADLGYLAFDIGYKKGVAGRLPTGNHRIEVSLEVHNKVDGTTTKRMDATHRFNLEVTEFPVAEELTGAPVATGPTGIEDVTSPAEAAAGMYLYKILAPAAGEAPTGARFVLATITPNADWDKLTRTVTLDGDRWDVDPSNGELYLNGFNRDAFTPEDVTVTMRDRAGNERVLVFRLRRDPLAEPSVASGDSQLTLTRSSDTPDGVTVYEYRYDKPQTLPANLDVANLTLNVPFDSLRPVVSKGTWTVVGTGEKTAVLRIEVFNRGSFDEADGTRLTSTLTLRDSNGDAQVIQFVLRLYVPVADAAETITPMTGQGFVQAPAAHGGDAKNEFVYMGNAAANQQVQLATIALADINLATMRTITATGGWVLDPATGVLKHDDFDGTFSSAQTVTVTVTLVDSAGVIRTLTYNIRPYVGVSGITPTITKDASAQDRTADDAAANHRHYMLQAPATGQLPASGPLPDARDTWSLGSIALPGITAGDIKSVGITSSLDSGGATTEGDKWSYTLTDDGSGGTSLAITMKGFNIADFTTQTITVTLTDWQDQTKVFTFTVEKFVSVATTTRLAAHSDSPFARGMGARGDTDYHYVYTGSESGTANVTLARIVLGEGFDWTMVLIDTTKMGEWSLDPSNGNISRMGFDFSTFTAEQTFTLKIEKKSDTTDFKEFTFRVRPFQELASTDSSESTGVHETWPGFVDRSRNAYTLNYVVEIPGSATAGKREMVTLTPKKSDGTALPVSDFKVREGSLSAGWSVERAAAGLVLSKDNLDPATFSSETVTLVLEDHKGNEFRRALNFRKYVEVSEVSVSQASGDVPFKKAKGPQGEVGNYIIYKGDDSAAANSVLAQLAANDGIDWRDVTITGLPSGWSVDSQGVLKGSGDLHTDARTITFRVKDAKDTGENDGVEVTVYIRPMKALSARVVEVAGDHVQALTPGTGIDYEYLFVAPTGDVLELAKITPSGSAGFSVGDVKDVTFSSTHAADNNNWDWRIANGKIEIFLKNFDAASFAEQTLTVTLSDYDSTNQDVTAKILVGQYSGLTTVTAEEVAGSEFKLLGDDSQGTYRFGFVAPGQGTTKDVELAEIEANVPNVVLSAAFTDADSGDEVSGWAFENDKVVRKALDTTVDFTAKKVRMTLTGKNQETQSVIFDLKPLTPLTSVTLGAVPGETPKGGISNEYDNGRTLIIYTYLLHSNVPSGEVALGKITPNSGVALGDLTVKLTPTASEETWHYNKKTGVVSLTNYNSASSLHHGVEMAISDKTGRSLQRDITVHRNQLPAAPVPVYGAGRESYDADLTTVTLRLPDANANADVGDSVQLAILVDDPDNTRDISDLFEIGTPSNGEVTLTRKQVGDQPVSLFDPTDRSPGARTLSGSIRLTDESGESVTHAFSIQVESPYLGALTHKAPSESSVSAAKLVTKVWTSADTNQRIDEGLDLPAGLRDLVASSSFASSGDALHSHQVGGSTTGLGFYGVASSSDVGGLLSGVSMVIEKYSGESLETLDSITESSNWADGSGDFRSVVGGAVTLKTALATSGEGVLYRIRVTKPGRESSYVYVYVVRDQKPTGVVGFDTFEPADVPDSAANLGMTDGTLHLPSGIASGKKVVEITDVPAGMKPKFRRSDETITDRTGGFTFSSTTVDDVKKWYLVTEDSLNYNSAASSISLNLVLENGFGEVSDPVAIQVEVGKPLGSLKAEGRTADGRAVDIPAEVKLEQGALPAAANGEVVVATFKASGHANGDRGAADTTYVLRVKQGDSFHTPPGNQYRWEHPEVRGNDGLYQPATIARFELRKKAAANPVDVAVYELVMIMLAGAYEDDGDRNLRSIGKDGSGLWGKVEFQVAATTKNVVGGGEVTHDITVGIDEEEGYAVVPLTRGVLVNLVEGTAPAPVGDGTKIGTIRVEVKLSSKSGTTVANYANQKILRLVIREDDLGENTQPNYNGFTPQAGQPGAENASNPFEIVQETSFQGSGRSTIVEIKLKDGVAMDAVAAVGGTPRTHRFEMTSSDGEGVNKVVNKVVNIELAVSRPAFKGLAAGADALSFKASEAHGRKGLEGSTLQGTITSGSLQLGNQPNDDNHMGDMKVNPPDASGLQFALVDANNTISQDPNWSKKTVNNGANTVWLHRVTGALHVTGSALSTTAVQVQVEVTTFGATSLKAKRDAAQKYLTDQEIALPTETVEALDDKISQARTALSLGADDRVEDAMAGYRTAANLGESENAKTVKGHADTMKILRGTAKLPGSAIAGEVSALIDKIIDLYGKYAAAELNEGGDAVAVKANLEKIKVLKDLYNKASLRETVTGEDDVVTGVNPAAVKTLVEKIKVLKDLYNKASLSETVTGENDVVTDVDPAGVKALVEKIKVLKDLYDKASLSETVTGENDVVTDVNPAGVKALVEKIKALKTLYKTADVDETTTEADLRIKLAKKAQLAAFLALEELYAEAGLTEGSSATDLKTTLEAIRTRLNAYTGLSLPTTTRAADVENLETLMGRIRDLKEKYRLAGLTEADGSASETTGTNAAIATELATLERAVAIKTLEPLYTAAGLGDGANPATLVELAKKIKTLKKLYADASLAETTNVGSQYSNLAATITSLTGIYTALSWADGKDLSAPGLREELNRKVTVGSTIETLLPLYTAAKLNPDAADLDVAAVQKILEALTGINDALATDSGLAQDSSLKIEGLTTSSTAQELNGKMTSLKATMLNPHGGGANMAITGEFVPRRFFGFKLVDLKKLAADYSTERQTAIWMRFALDIGVVVKQRIDASLLPGGTLDDSATGFGDYKVKPSEAELTDKQGGFSIEAKKYLTAVEVLEKLKTIVEDTTKLTGQVQADRDTQSARIDTAIALLKKMAAIERILADRAAATDNNAATKTWQEAYAAAGGTQGNISSEPPTTPTAQTPAPLTTTTLKTLLTAVKAVTKAEADGGGTLAEAKTLYQTLGGTHFPAAYSAAIHGHLESLKTHLDKRGKELGELKAIKAVIDKEGTGEDNYDRTLAQLKSDYSTQLGLTGAAKTRLETTLTSNTDTEMGTLVTALEAVTTAQTTLARDMGQFTAASFPTLTTLRTGAGDLPADQTLTQLRDRLTQLKAISTTETTKSLKAMKGEYLAAIDASARIGVAAKLNASYSNDTQWTTALEELDTIKGKLTALKTAIQARSQGKSVADLVTEYRTNGGTARDILSVSAADRTTMIDKLDQIITDETVTQPDGSSTQRTLATWRAELIEAGNDPTDKVEETVKAEADKLQAILTKQGTDPGNYGQTLGQLKEDYRTAGGTADLTGMDDGAMAGLIDKIETVITKQGTGPGNYGQTLGQLKADYREAGGTAALTGMDDGAMADLIGKIDPVITKQGSGEGNYDKTLGQLKADYRKDGGTADLTGMDDTAMADLIGKIDAVITKQGSGEGNYNSTLAQLKSDYSPFVGGLQTAEQLTDASVAELTAAIGKIQEVIEKEGSYETSLFDLYESDTITNGSKLKGQQLIDAKDARLGELIRNLQAVIDQEGSDNYGQTLAQLKTGYGATTTDSSPDTSAAALTTRKANIALVLAYENDHPKLKVIKQGTAGEGTTNLGATITALEKVIKAEALEENEKKKEYLKAKAAFDKAIRTRQLAFSKNTPPEFTGMTLGAGLDSGDSATASTRNGETSATAFQILKNAAAPANPASPTQTDYRIAEISISASGPTVEIFNPFPRVTDSNLGIDDLAAGDIKTASAEQLKYRQWWFWKHFEIKEVSVTGEDGTVTLKYYLHRRPGADLYPAANHPGTAGQSDTLAYRGRIVVTDSFGDSVQKEVHIDVHEPAHGNLGWVAATNAPAEFASGHVEGAFVPAEETLPRVPHDLIIARMGEFVGTKNVRQLGRVYAKQLLGSGEEPIPMGYIVTGDTDKSQDNTATIAGVTLTVDGDGNMVLTGDAVSRDTRVFRVKAVYRGDETAETHIEVSFRARPAVTAVASPQGDTRGGQTGPLWERYYESDDRSVAVANREAALSTYKPVFYLDPKVPVGKVLATLSVDQAAGDAFLGTFVRPIVVALGKGESQGKWHGEDLTNAEALAVFNRLFHVAFETDENGENGAWVIKRGVGPDSDAADIAADATGAYAGKRYGVGIAFVDRYGTQSEVRRVDVAFYERVGATLPVSEGTIDTEVRRNDSATSDLYTVTNRFEPGLPMDSVGSSVGAVPLTLTIRNGASSTAGRDINLVRLQKYLSTRNAQTPSREVVYDLVYEVSDKSSGETTRKIATSDSSLEWMGSDGKKIGDLYLKSTGEQDITITGRQETWLVLRFPKGVNEIDVTEGDGSTVTPARFKLVARIGDTRERVVQNVEVRIDELAAASSTLFDNDKGAALSNVALTDDPTTPLPAYQFVEGVKGDLLKVNFKDDDDPTFSPFVKITGISQSDWLESKVPVEVDDNGVKHKTSVIAIKAGNSLGKVTGRTLADQKGTNGDGKTYHRVRLTYQVFESQGKLDTFSLALDAFNVAQQEGVSETALQGFRTHMESSKGEEKTFDFLIDVSKYKGLKSRELVKTVRGDLMIQGTDVRQGKAVQQSDGSLKILIGGGQNFGSRKVLAGQVESNPSDVTDMRYDIEGGTKDDQFSTKSFGDLEVSVDRSSGEISISGSSSAAQSDSFKILGQSYRFLERPSITKAKLDQLVAAAENPDPEIVADSKYFAGGTLPTEWKSHSDFEDEVERLRTELGMTETEAINLDDPNRDRAKLQQLLRLESAWMYFHHYWNPSVKVTLEVPAVPTVEIRDSSDDPVLAASVSNGNYVIREDVAKSKNLIEIVPKPAKGLDETTVELKNAAFPSIFKVVKENGKHYLRRIGNIIDDPGSLDEIRFIETLVIRDEFGGTVEHRITVEVQEVPEGAPTFAPTAGAGIVPAAYDPSLPLPEGAERPYWHHYLIRGSQENYGSFSFPAAPLAEGVLYMIRLVQSDSRLGTADVPPIAPDGVLTQLPFMTDASGTTEEKAGATFTIGVQAQRGGEDVGKEVFVTFRFAEPPAAPVEPPAAPVEPEAPVPLDWNRERLFGVPSVIEDGHHVIEVGIIDAPGAAVNNQLARDSFQLWLNQAPLNDEMTSRMTIAGENADKFRELFITSEVFALRNRVNFTAKNGVVAEEGTIRFTLGIDGHEAVKIELRLKKAAMKTAEPSADLFADRDPGRASRLRYDQLELNTPQTFGLNPGNDGTNEYALVNKDGKVLPSIEESGLSIGIGTDPNTDTNRILSIVKTSEASEVPASLDFFIRKVSSELQYSPSGEILGIDRIATIRPVSIRLDRSTAETVPPKTLLIPAGVGAGRSSQWVLENGEYGRVLNIGVSRGSPGSFTIGHILNYDQPVGTNPLNGLRGFLVIDRAFGLSENPVDAIGSELALPGGWKLKIGLGGGMDGPYSVTLTQPTTPKGMELSLPETVRLYSRLKTATQTLASDGPMTIRFHWFGTAPAAAAAAGEMVVSEAPPVTLDMITPRVSDGTTVMARAQERARQVLAGTAETAPAAPDVLSAPDVLLTSPDILTAPIASLTPDAPSEPTSPAAPSASADGKGTSGASLIAPASPVVAARVPAALRAVISPAAQQATALRASLPGSLAIQVVDTTRVPLNHSFQKSDYPTPGEFLPTPFSDEEEESNRTEEPIEEGSAPGRSGESGESGDADRPQANGIDHGNALVRKTALQGNEWTNPLQRKSGWSLKDQPEGAAAQIVGFAGLPAWLSYDPAASALIGEPPAGTEGSVTVTAVLASGEKRALTLKVGAESALAQKNPTDGTESAREKAQGHASLSEQVEEERSEKNGLSDKLELLRQITGSNKAA